jgi:hypothetical protein
MEAVTKPEYAPVLANLEEAEGSAWWYQYGPEKKSG